MARNYTTREIERVRSSPPLVASFTREFRGIEEDSSVAVTIRKANRQICVAAAARKVARPRRTSADSRPPLWHLPCGASCVQHSREDRDVDAPARGSKRRLFRCGRDGRGHLVVSRFDRRSIAGDRWVRRAGDEHGGTAALDGASDSGPAAYT